MFTQKFIGTLQGKDIIKQKSGIHIINSSGTIIQYQLLDNFNKKEIAFIEEQLLKACFFTKKSIAELKLPTLKSLEAATDAFLRYDNDAITVILKKLSEIYDVLLNKMAFKRKSVCEDKKQTLDYVYISTNPDTHSTTVYDKFFEHDEYFERIFTRSSLLIHEASHLTGLREEAGSDVFLNAENYRKFICLLFDIAKFDELYPNGNMGKTLPLKSNIGRKEFPNPDQPRNDKGQWEKKYHISFSRTDKTTHERNFVEDIEKGTSIKEQYESNHSEIWAASDIKIDGFTPNSDQTIILSVTYDYFGIEGSKTETYNVVYDVKSDEEGTIVLERVGFANIDSSSIGSMNAHIKIYTQEGRASENFKNVSKSQWTSSKDKVGSYLISHAGDLSYNELKYKNEYNYGGGLINDFTPKNTPIYSGTLKIK